MGSRRSAQHDVQSVHTGLQTGFKNGNCGLILGERSLKLLHLALCGQSLGVEELGQLQHLLLHRYLLPGYV